MFKPGDKVIRIPSALNGRFKKDKIYTVQRVVDDAIRLLEREVTGAWNPAYFKLAPKTRRKTKVTKPKFKRYFIKRDKKAVHVYDIETKKLVHTAEEVGIFFPMQAKLGNFKGYTGYVQEVVTKSFIKEYEKDLDKYNFVLPDEYDYCNFCVIKPDAYISMDLPDSDSLTGMKGLRDQMIDNNFDDRGW